MKAIQVTGPRRLELAEVPVPEPAEGEVLAFAEMQESFFGVANRTQRDLDNTAGRGEGTVRGSLVGINSMVGGNTE